MSSPPIAVPGDALFGLIETLGVHYWTFAKRDPAFAREMQIDATLDSAIRAAHLDTFRAFAYMVQDLPDPLQGGLGPFGALLKTAAEGNLGLVRHAHGAIRGGLRFAQDPVAKAMPVGAHRMAQAKSPAAPAAMATADALVTLLSDRLEAEGVRTAHRRDDLTSRIENLSKALLDRAGRSGFERERTVLRAAARPPAPPAPGQPANANRPDAPARGAISPELAEVLSEFDALTGLDDVKEQVVKLYCLTRLWQDQTAAGEKVERPSLHLVFTGNPGTGKTTVARLFGKLLKAMGVLKRGHTVETDRGGMVAEHIGGTAPRTQQVVNSALDGVLFIDEAYALAPQDIKGGRDFGHEALSTLLKAMEDQRERLVVILAGYTAEMNAMIASNPGLASRFPRQIDFRDYNGEELGEIFDNMMRGHGLAIDDDVRDLALQRLDEERAFGNFGNARTVRNLVEALQLNLAYRRYAHELRTHLPVPAEEVGNRIQAIDVDRLPDRLSSGSSEKDPNKAPPVGGGFGSGPASPRRMAARGPRLG